MRAARRQAVQDLGAPPLPPTLEAEEEEEVPEATDRLLLAMAGQAATAEEGT